MSKLSNKIKKTFTVVSSTDSFTYANLRNMSLYHMFVKPTSADTVYDITITDIDDMEIFKETGYNGNRTITNKDDLPNIIVGNFTLTIDANNDEDFQVSLYFTEDL